MAVQHLTYLDMAPEQRARAAREARNRIRSLLANPFLTPDQATQLNADLARLGQWEQGALPVPVRK